LTAVGGFGLLEGVDWVAPLVGRRAELRMLTDVVTREPGPDVVVVVGEAGVGKSRLIGALMERAGAAGVTVLKGDCLPLTDSVPFLPVMEALRGLAAARPAVRERCAPAVRAEVARLIPEWDTSPGRQDPGPVAGWQRGRLFSALRDLLAMAAADGTCALLIEDLHWADASTLDFLAYLCAAGQDVATPVVLTCREEETGPTRPIGRWITDLARRHDVTRMPLGRLSRPEAAEQISGLLHAAPSPSVVDEVFTRAGGNPFFTEQIVAAVRSKGRPELPESLAELLIARVAETGDDCRAVLAALAVAGRGLDDAVLTAVTGLDRPRLAGAVRKLVEARLLDRPGADERFRLRHVLLGEAINGDMLAGELRDRHAGFARALGVAKAAEGAGEVAEHWAAAGRVIEEMPCRVAAAGEAEQVGAYRETAVHWRRVIDLWPQVPAEARPAGLDLAAVYLSALAALDRCGDSRAAGPLAEQAVTAVAATADPRRLALLYDRVSTYRWVDDDRRVLAPLDIALRLLADFPPGREQAMVLHTYAARVADAGPWALARPYLARALEACLAAGPAADDIRIKVLRDLGFSAMHAGDIDTGMRQLAEAGALADDIGDHYAAAGVTVWRALSVAYLGHLEQSAAEMRSGLLAARRFGLDGSVFAEFMSFHYFKALAELGRPAEAGSLIPGSPESTPISGVSMARAYLDLLAGDDAAAAARITAIDAAMSPANANFGDSLVTLCEIDLWRHRPERALHRFQRIPDVFDQAVQWNYMSLILAVAMRACADLAEAARARHDEPGVQEIRRVADDLVDRHAAMRPDPFAEHPFCCTTGADGATWAAELTRVAGNPDPEAWAAAAAAWDGLGRPHRTAYARWRQAEALLRAGGRTVEVRDVLRTAAASAHGHAPLIAEIRALARLARLDLRDGPPAAGAPPSPAPYGLTERESMVLRLLAAGLSNTEIGARLFISAKTASVHVTNILRKLDVKNRTEAAALAHRAGLLHPGPH
jgi:DNA-binding CsgD family transcriptional regulator